MKVNKGLLALGAVIFVILVILIWPSNKSNELEIPLDGPDRIDLEKADSDVSAVDKETLENFEGIYEGMIEINSLELAARSFLAKIPVAKAKADLEDSLQDGFPVSFKLDEDGRWELDLGQAFSQYQITTIISTSEDIIEKDKRVLGAKRSFYIPDLDDNLYLRLNGNLLDQLVGTFILEGENKLMELSVTGSYKLDKN